MRGNRRIRMFSALVCIVDIIVVSLLFPFRVQDLNGLFLVSGNNLASLRFKPGKFCVWGKYFWACLSRSPCGVEAFSESE
jgi:hypothetical protein